MTSGAEDGGRNREPPPEPHGHAHRRRLPPPAFAAPLLLWALFCALVCAGVAAHLLRASAEAMEGVHARVEAVAATAEHTLLRAFEAVQGVHDLLQPRQSLVEAEETPGIHAIQSHIQDLVDRGRFGIVQAGVTDDRGFALLLLDIDHFKAVNDTHGHAAGDAVLRDVAGVLLAEIRRGDLACRWGGEEMLAILKDCDLARAEERAARLRAAIAAARPGGVPGLRVTASIGVAASPGHGAGLDDLLKRADKALYLAKRHGRDRVVRAEAMAPAA